jgi:hypothetical protein
MNQFYSTRYNNPAPFTASASGIWGSNNYLGGKKQFTNTLGYTFTTSTTYQNGRSGWSPLVPRNTDTGTNFSGTQLCCVHPDSNWIPYLAELGITNVLWGRKYEFTSFNVQQERGTILSYGSINLSNYLALRTSGGTLSMSVFNSYQNGGTYDGSSDGRTIPAVLWSHHWSGGSGYAQWRYGYNTAYTVPEFLPGRYNVFWASAGTVQGSPGTFLSSYTYNVGVNDLVFPVLDDQNDGGSWNMSIGVQAYW